MWVFFSILSAFGWATSDAFSKRALGEGVKEASVIWLRYVISLPFLLPFLFVMKLPRLDPFFFKLHFVWLPLEVTALFLYMRAIKISPLSLTVPFLSLTPAFLLFTQWLFLGEKASITATFGIVLIVIGSYLLSSTIESGSLLRPFFALFREKGSVLMVLVALIYSFTSVFGKMLIMHSSPIFFSVYYTFIMAVILTPLYLARGRGSNLKRNYKPVILASFFFALMIVSHMLALFQTKVAYMIALKRLSSVIGVIYGGLFFKEKFIHLRLVGALLMVLGAILISIWG